MGGRYRSLDCTQFREGNRLSYWVNWYSSGGRRKVPGTYTIYGKERVDFSMSTQLINK
jgi:hypothetical protein